MIPRYPEFKKLELTDKKYIQKHVHRYPNHSDFNFVSLWVYDVESDLQISILDDNLIVRMRDYISGIPFYTFLGLNKIKNTIHMLFERSELEGLEKRIRLLPEAILSEKELLEFDVREDRDNFDYILSNKEHAELAGGNFHKHRKLIHRFSKQFPSMNARLLEIENKELQKKLLSIFHKWELAKNKSEVETSHELKALMRLFANPTVLNIVAGGVFIDDDLISFLIVDVNHHEYAQSHFFKHNPAYEGGAQYLRHFMATHLHERGHLYLNIEQDLGEYGLRVAKEQWHPISYTKKFSIYPKLR